MRDYILKFFEDFSYQKSDAEFLLSAYDKIIENPDANTIWQEAISRYESDINCDFNELLNCADKVSNILSIHKYTTELLLCICLTKRLKAVYESKNISLEIFHNSILDLRYKLEECKLVKGILGSFVGFWFDGWFNLKRFALGRLQFHLSDLGIDYNKDGISLSSNCKALAVHIPRSGAPLSVNACDESFNMAKSFFKNEFNDICVFTCHSWLLYPENEKILSVKSNIYKFMKRFDIIDFGVSENNDDLWRIYDTDEKDINLLPCDSSLRKAYVEYLKNGGKMGWGFGIIAAEFDFE